MLTWLKKILPKYGSYIDEEPDLSPPSVTEKRLHSPALPEHMRLRIEESEKKDLPVTIVVEINGSIGTGHIR